MVSRISGDRLFLPEIDLDRYPREIPLFPNLILQEAAVGILDILGQIDEAGELGRGCRQLHHVFDFDVFAFGRRGRIIFDDRQQVVVQRRGGHAPLAVFVNPDGGLEHFEDALFVEYRGEDDRNVVEGRQFFARTSFHSFIVLLPFSTRSHLLTTITHPLRLRTIRLWMFRSWDSRPCCASSIRIQTSDSSMARIERITE